MKVITTKVPKSIGIEITLMDLLNNIDGMDFYPDGGFDDSKEGYVFDTTDEITVTVNGKVVKPDSVKIKFVDPALRDV